MQDFREISENDYIVFTLSTMKRVATHSHGEATHIHGEATHRHGEATHIHGEATHRHGEATHRHGERSKAKRRVVEPRL